MCMGGGHPSSGPNHMLQTDPTTGYQYYTEEGVPLEYAVRGANTVAQYQTMANQDLSDKQIAAQKEISDKQDAFNRQQLADQEAQQAAQQKAAQEQADRQTAYDTGRAQNLAAGSQAVNDAFKQFNDDYFNKYASDYMKQVGDQVSYQKDQATKTTGYDMARAGLADSQAHVNQLGLLEETAGRTLADETQLAQNQANTLKTNILNTKTGLLDQVQASESIGSPIAGSTMDDVNAALQTQRSSISGISSSANDAVAATSGVPQVSTLGNIFASALSGVGSYGSGVQANNTLKAAGLKPTSPFG